MKKTLFVLIAIISLLSCNEEKKQHRQSANVAQKESTYKEDKVEDNYVYIDAYGCLHTDKKCICLIFQDGNLDRPHYKIQYRLKGNLRSSMYTSYCNRCTEVVDYENLKKICIKNERLRAYNILVANGYQCGGSFAEFDSIITDSESAREWLYQNSEVRDMINTVTMIEQFADALGLPLDFIP